MELTTLQQKLKKLKEDRILLRDVYERERIILNKEINEITSLLRVAGRESEQARILRAQPHVIFKDPTPQQIRRQIDNLIDGGGAVENISIDGGDVEDLIFYLEKKLEC